MAKPTRKEMVAYLRDHFRYHTMNSWNNATSYAKNVKIHSLGLTSEQRNRAYELLDAEGTYDAINARMDDFAIEHGYQYQMFFNGRSSGYIVLVPGGQEPSGYQSFCTKCGQLNYKKVLPDPKSASDTVRNCMRTLKHLTEEVIMQEPWITESGLDKDTCLNILREVRDEARAGIEYTASNKCGRCDKLARKNFEKPHMRVFTRPGIGIDMGADFEDKESWDNYTLRQRYDLVKDFDAAVDDCIAEFKSLIDNCKVVERTIMVPKTVRVIKCAHAEA